MTLDKSRLAMGLTAALVLALVGWTVTRSHTNPSSAKVSASVIGAAQPTAPTETTPQAVLLGKPANSGPKVGHTVVYPFPGLPRSRLGQPLDGDPFIASSIEEQRWLDRNGYPNAKQLFTLNNAPDGLLKLAAEAGDKSAAALYEARKLSHGDAQSGAALMTQGMQGNNFALSLLSAYMAGSSHGNPSLAYSISRVAEMRGDWRAGPAREMGPLANLNSLKRIQAETAAQQMFKDMRKHSTVRPFVDTRPGP